LGNEKKREEKKRKRGKTRQKIVEAKAPCDLPLLRGREGRGERKKGEKNGRGGKRQDCAKIEVTLQTNQIPILPFPIGKCVERRWGEKKRKEKKEKLSLFSIAVSKRE